LLDISSHHTTKINIKMMQKYIIQCYQQLHYSTCINMSVNHFKDINVHQE